MARGGRLLKARDSLTHVWGDETMTSFMPGHVYVEADVLEGDSAERRAFFDQAVKVHLFEDVTEEEEDGGRRARPESARRASG